MWYVNHRGIANDSAHRTPSSVTAETLDPNPTIHRWRVIGVPPPSAILSRTNMKGIFFGGAKRHGEKNKCELNLEFVTVIIFHGGLDDMVLVFDNGKPDRFFCPPRRNVWESKSSPAES